jgi:calcineurin-like phosphoesterase family protein
MKYQDKKTLKIDFTKNVWITSDTHFSHKNICRGVTEWRTMDGEVPISQTRDFKDVESMNQKIVDNINNNVGQDDILIHLGDWSFGGFENIQKFRDRLICKNIYITLGNHDHHIRSNREDCQGLFLDVYLQQVVVYGDYTFMIEHYPIKSWYGLNKGVIHLHGHTHLPENLRFGRGKMMDVGIDGHPEFRPYNLKHEIIPIMNKRDILSEMPNDHHAERLLNSK